MKVQSVPNKTGPCQRYQKQIRVATIGSKMPGRKLGIPDDWYWRLAEARPEQLNNWRLIGGGQGISWEDLEEDFILVYIAQVRMPIMPYLKNTMAKTAIET